MLSRALAGIGVVDEHVLDELVIEKPRAVHEFVEHPGGEECGRCRLVGSGLVHGKKMRITR